MLGRSTAPAPDPERLPLKRTVIEGMCAEYNLHGYLLGHHINSATSLALTLYGSGVITGFAFEGKRVRITIEELPS